MLRRWKQFWCGLIHGHDHLTIFETNRMFQRCQSCEFETPGWTIDGCPPKQIYRVPERWVRPNENRLVGAAR
jgi:hypothetical protein